MAVATNYANPQDPGLQDFGQLSLQSEKAHGFIRVDWYTPDGLPTWGDGRLTILGTKGYIELRKYTNIGVEDTKDNLYLVNDKKCEYIDCRDAGYPYFQNLSNDICNRTETAMQQSHCFKVMELALKAQEMADTSLQAKVNTSAKAEPVC